MKGGAFSKYDEKLKKYLSNKKYFGPVLLILANCDFKL